VRPDIEARFINTYYALIDEETPLEKTKSKIRLAFTLAHPSWQILSVKPIRMTFLLILADGIGISRLEQMQRTLPSSVPWSNERHTCSSSRTEQDVYLLPEEK
jgi:hypothetical protein